MKIEVSNGEILDKLAILNIKLNKITDKTKLININNEYQYLLQSCSKLLNDKKIEQLFVQLHHINSELWKIEDDIREKERLKEFDTEFIELARKVYMTNDLRAKVKKEINVTSGSNLVEEKSYEQY